MSKNDEILGTGFAAPSQKEWRALVDKALRGADFDETLVHKTPDGTVRGPLHTQADIGAQTGAPGQFPFVRGIEPHINTARPWHITQYSRAGSPKGANADMLDDLQGGGSAVCLVFDSTGVNGTAVHTIEDMETALDGVDLSIAPILMRPCPDSLQYAAMLLAIAKKRGVNMTDLSGSLGLSPIGQTVFKGLQPQTLPTRLGNATRLAKWCTQNTPNLRTVTITASLIHEAGGSAALEIAFAAAGGFSYVKAFVEGGLSPSQAAQTILFDFSMEADVPLGVAKLRAARRVWANIMSALGCEGADAAMNIHAGTSRAMMSKAAPYTNVLRTSTAAFAAALGGAQYISVEPHDLALGTQYPAARRLARNAQIILQEEAGAGMVADPMGGSYTIEAMSDDLAQAAWAIFQDIESKGGLAKAALSGWLGEFITAQRQTLMDEIKSGKRKLLGVNAFVQQDEVPPVSPRAAPPLPAPKGTPFPVEFSVDEYVHAAANKACITPQIGGDPIADFLPIRFCAPFEGGKAGEL